MKSHIRTKGPIFSMRLRGPHAAGRVLESIKNITCELEELQAEIYNRMGGPAEMLEGFSLREREPAERALSDFRLALDQLRYVLWLSLEPKSRGALETGDTLAKDTPAQAEGDGRPHTPADVRLSPPRGKSSEQAPTSASFFDHLDVVIEACLSKDTAAQAVSKKRLPKP
jgi:hypothetical protein